MERCTHTDQIRDVQPSAQGCEECLEIGDIWVHVRECLVCGHVGSCDSLKNKHATKALPRYQSSYSRFVRAGRSLAVVLRARDLGLRTFTCPTC
jgi:hypothetical protein